MARLVAGGGGTKKRRRPTRRQIQQSKAQARQYRSQGRAVERVANQQQRASGRVRPAPRVQPGLIRQTERRQVERHKRSPGYRKALREAKQARFRAIARDQARAYRSQGRAVRRAARVGPGVPTRQRIVPRYGRAIGQASFAPAGLVAPALKILEQTTRPVHAIAAAAREDVRDIKAGRLPVFHGSLKKAGEGFALKDKSLFSDVLKEAGVKNKAVRTIAGFALDVGLDPTTYLSGGTAAARHLAAEAGTKATKNALRSGASKVEARAIGKRAAAKVLSKGDHPAAEVRFAGRKIARIRDPKRVERAGERVRSSGGGQLLRHVNPNMRPPGVRRVDWERARHARRREQAIVSRGERESKNRAIAISRATREKGAHERVTDAIESRDLSKLQGKERQAAEGLVHDYGRIFDRERHAKLIGQKLNDLGYVPRRPLSELEPHGSRKVQRGAAKLTSSKMRTERRARSEFRGSGDDIYLADVALGRYLRGRESAVKLGRAQTYRELQRIGQRFKGQQLKDGEAVYRFHPRQGVTELKGDELKAVLRRAPGLPDGKYIVLSKALVDRTIPGAMQGRIADLDDLGRLWDRGVQGRIKTILTVPNPQYHLTNLYGDLFNAFLGQNVAGLARNLGVSVKTLTRKARVEASSRTLGKQLDPTGRGVKIGGQRITYDQLIREAEEHGAVGQGFLGRDLPEVLEQQGRQMREQVGKGRIAGRTGKVGERAAGSKVGRRVLHPIDTIRDVSQYREDAVRLVTYLGARRRGMTPDQAAAWVARQHFDYGDLTTFERSVLRRVLPFYTFTARNTVLQAKTLVTNPGKFANVEKLREELAGTAGLPDGWEGQLQEYEQRGLPFAMPIKDAAGNVLTLYPKLPWTDLNRLGPRGQMDAILAMVTPIIKIPIELSQNHSFFFKGPIDKYGDAVDPVTGKKVPQLRPAPGFLAGDPRLRTLFGIRRYTDKRTGKRIWGWPVRTNYLAQQAGPAAGTAIQLGTTVPNTRGQSKELRAFGFLTGLKVAPLEVKRSKENQLYAQRAYLEALTDSMRNQEYPRPAYDATGNPTPEYRKLLDQKNTIEKQLGISGGRPKPSGPPSRIDWNAARGGTAAPQIDWSAAKP